MDNTVKFCLIGTFCLGLIFVLLLLGANHKTVRLEDENVEIGAYGNRWQTTYYNGHSYVTQTYDRNMTMVHNPDCPCFKK
jgi:hypothetical protein